MKITALGVGSCLSMQNLNSSFLLEIGDIKILFDCGYDTKEQLKSNNLSVNDLDGVYVSHCHMDHCAHLEWLGYMALYVCNKRLKLYCHPVILSDLEVTFSKSLLVTRFGKISMAEMFDIVRLDPIYPVTICSKITLHSHLLNHVKTNSPELPKVMNAALSINEPLERTLITGDYCDKNEIIDLINSHDTILTDCEFIYDKNNRPMYSEVHPHWTFLKQLYVLNKKVWIYHYGDNVANNFDKWNAEVKKHGYMGLISESMIIQTGY